MSESSSNNYYENYTVVENHSGKNLFQDIFVYIVNLSYYYALDCNAFQTKHLFLKTLSLNNFVK